MQTVVLNNSLSVRVWILVISIFAIPNVAVADQIPPAYERMDFDSCTKAAATNPNLTPRQVSVYCTCTNQQLRDKYDYAGYKRMLIELRSGNPAADIKKSLEDIAATCNAVAF